MATEEISAAARVHLQAFKREVEDALPGLVSRVTLFGSRARGDADGDSDYDVAVFIQDSHDYRQVRDTVADVAYPHILDGIHISAVVLPARYAEDCSRSELAWEIARDGVVL